MPIKIFSHQADPDGLGCIILSKKCFDEVDYTLCKNVPDLDYKLDKFITSFSLFKILSSKSILGHKSVIKIFS